MNELIFFKIPPQDACLFIANLHISVTEEELLGHLKKHGLIYSLKINRDAMKNDGDNQGKETPI